jgi:hypothetical protein
MISIRCTF